MATSKKRINISVSRDVDRALTALAKRDEVPGATKAEELIRLAILIEEDLVLNEIVSKRDKKNSRFVSHNLAWK